MRIRSILLVVGMLAVGLVVAGCGDDDETTTAGATGATGATGANGAPLSKSEFIKQADAICKQGDQQIDEEARQTFAGGQQPTQEEEEQFATDTVIPNIESQVQQIRALPPPEGDEDQVSAILDAADSGLEEAKSDPSVFTQGGSGDPLAEATQLAKDYGLKACGQG